MITRRKAIVAATLAPQLLHAQTPRTRKLGYLHGATISPDSFAMSIFGPAWRRLGYRDGETVLLRSGEGRSERMVAATQELIGLGAEAIIAVGPQAVRELFQKFKDMFSFSQHNIMNPIIDVDGNRATAQWYIAGPWDQTEGDRKTWMTLRYNDDYVKINGEWKYQHLRVALRMLEDR